MATIYILEDDLNIQEIEAYALKNSGYQTEGFDNARDFFKKVSERVPSLLLLDIMLPDADGLDVLRKEQHLWHVNFRTHWKALWSRPRLASSEASCWMAFIPSTASPMQMQTASSRPMRLTAGMG